MSKSRRERVQEITRYWGVNPVDGWQAAVADELRALWAREELLKAMLLKMRDHGKSSHLTPQQWAADLLAVLDAHDKEQMEGSPEEVEK
jgi:hypothetical protein